MISITKKFEFHAAHHLPNHLGACNNVHGHSYLLEITIVGDIIREGPETGMVMDFSELKRIVTLNILDKVDHVDLNTIYKNPTAEEMVEDFARILAAAITTEISWVHRIRLYETSTSYVEWRCE